MSAANPTLWLRVRLSPWPLDAELAAGIDPASDPALALRAAQLCSPRHRRRLASWVERLARQSESDPAPGLSSAVPRVGERVVEARDSLVRIAAVLRGPEPVSPRGVAMLQRLLTDARSALYTDTANGAVELQVRAALEGLVGSATGAAAAISASATPEGRPRLTQTA
jgi:hypothetical protein